MQKVTSDFNKLIKETIEEINKHLGNYRDLVLRFLERMGRSKDVNSIRSYSLILSSHILSPELLDDICNELKKVDDVLKEVLRSNLSNEEMEMLHSILRVMHEIMKYKELRMDDFLKKLDPKKKSLLLNLCTKGVIECVIRV